MKEEFGEIPWKEKISGETVFTSPGDPRRENLSPTVKEFKVNKYKGT